MIFQIDYKSNKKYDKYFEYNKQYNIPNLIIFDDKLIDTFLKKYDYYDQFMKFKVKPEHEYAKGAILCDALRLMIMYEIGGIYIDADVYFTPEILNLENNIVDKFGDKTILLSSRSFFFMRAKKRSRYIGDILAKYLKTEIISLDIYMLRKIELNKYIDEIMIVPEQFTKKYFDHEQITTGNSPR